MRSKSNERPRGWKKFALNHISAIDEKVKEKVYYDLAYMCAAVCVGDLPESILDVWGVEDCDICKMC